MNFDVHDAKASKRSGACKACWNWTAVCYSFKFPPCFMHYINLDFSEWKVSKHSLTVRLKRTFLPKLQEDLRVSRLWGNSADVCHVYASGLVIHFKNLPPSVIELWQLHACTIFPHVSEAPISCLLEIWESSTNTCWGSMSQEDEVEWEKCEAERENG